MTRGDNLPAVVTDPPRPTPLLPTSEAAEAYGLNARQAAFVVAYVTHHDGARAVREAGYTRKGNGSRHQAKELLKRDDVQAAIADYEAKIADHAGATAYWIVTRLMQIVEACMVEVPKTYQGGVVKVRCGEGCDDCPHVVYEMADPGTAHQALKTLAQHRGMLTERIDITSKQVRFEIVGVPMEELT